MPRPGESQTINGRTMSWQPTTKARDAFNYQGENSGYASAEDAQAADEAGDDGSWVPSSFGNPNGTLFGPSWMLPAMIGGPAAAAGLGALFGLGGAAASGGTAAATGGASAALPVSAGLPASLGVGGSTAVGGFGGASAAGGGAGALGMIAGTNPYVNLATNVGTGALNAYTQGKQSDRQIAEQQRQFDLSQAQQQRQFDATQAQGQANQALNASQMNPLAPAANRQQMALLNMLMNNYSPMTYSNGQFSGGTNALTPAMFQGISQYSSPEAMAAQEGAFNANAGAASGNQFVAPTTPSVGYPVGRASAKPPGMVTEGSLVNPVPPPTTESTASASANPALMPPQQNDTNLNALIARLTGRNA